MKHRSLIKMFLLMIVTLGIYRLYWFTKTRSEMMSVKPVKIPSVWVLIIPVVLIGLMVLMLFINLAQIYSVADSCGTDTLSAVYQACSERIISDSRTSTNSTMTGILLGLLGLIPVALWWIWKYSKAVEEITGEKISFVMSMLVLTLVPDGLDILIIQDGFNKVALVPAQASPATPIATGS